MIAVQQRLLFGLFYMASYIVVFFMYVTLETQQGAIVSLKHCAVVHMSVMFKSALRCVYISLPLLICTTFQWDQSY